VDASISFADSLAGLDLRVRVQKPETCEHCHGSGAEPPTRPERCPTCLGAGQIGRNEGFFSIAETCPTCNGLGEVVRTPCRVCSGEGTVLREHTYRVPVPAGVRDKAQLRIPRRGTAGAKGGPPGDLLVHVAITDNPGFERSGDNFEVDLPVPFVDAALGAQVSVPLPEGGAVRVKVPPGSSEGKRLRVRGRGAPKRDGSRGDLIARVHLQVPDKLTAEQEQALNAYRKASQG
jgi:molecular chaperone DnaJ